MTVHFYPVAKLPNYKVPEKIKGPKTRLTRIFNQELSANRRYVDYQDAIKIARKRRAITSTFGMPAALASRGLPEDMF